MTPMTFFSVVHLDEPTQHHAYNQWHQFDHRPENLALPGMAWGDRWARTAEPERATDPQFAELDYLAMYWFRPPVRESIAEWNQLGSELLPMGSGPHDSRRTPFPDCLLPSAEG